MGGVIIITVLSIIHSNRDMYQTASIERPYHMSLINQASPLYRARIISLSLEGFSKHRFRPLVT